MAPVQTLGSAEGSIEINEATEEKCSFSRRERVCVCIVGWPSCKVPYMYIVIDLCPAGMDVVGLNFSAVSAKQVMAIPSGISSRAVPFPYGFVASDDARVTLFFTSAREGIVT